jgi:transposase
MICSPDTADRQETVRPKMSGLRKLAQIEESVARYLHQLDSGDRQKPSPALSTKPARLREKIVRLRQKMERLAALEARMREALDLQASLTDPDSRSMAASGRGSVVVGYNVQTAVDTMGAVQRSASKQSPAASD